MNNLELFILTIAIVLFFIGTLKVHLYVRSKSSLSMLLSFIFFFVFGVLYLVTWIFVNFYYNPDNAPKLLSHFLASIGPITDLTFLFGAISFLWFSRGLKEKRCSKE